MKVDCCRKIDVFVFLDLEDVVFLLDDEVKVKKEVLGIWKKDRLIDKGVVWFVKM